MHRGGAVASAAPRVVFMNVYGRPWWKDAVNYEGGDYGGFEAPAREADEGAPALVAPAAKRPHETMFWGLVNQWEGSLRRELDADARAGATAMAAA